MRMSAQLTCTCRANEALDNIVQNVLHTSILNGVVAACQGVRHVSPDNIFTDVVLVNGF
jgi:hypothetical protein